MKSSKTGRVDLPCAQSTIIEMEEGFTGLNFTLPVNIIDLLEVQNSNNIWVTGRPLSSIWINIYVAFQAPRIVAPNMIPSVYLPSCLKSQSRSKSKVVCTYYKDKSLFQVWQYLSSRDKSCGLFIFYYPTNIYSNVQYDITVSVLCRGDRLMQFFWMT